MMSAESDAWSQLVCITDIYSEPVVITKDRLFIGRTDGSDICHAGNKLISGKHCYIERDKQGRAWLYDTSTNGTLLNLKFKLTKGECRELQHGDEFHLVYKKDNPDENIGYMFQDMKSLEAETSSDCENTQEYEYVDPNATQEDIECNIASVSSLEEKRKISEECEPPPHKKIKQDLNEPQTFSKDTKGKADTKNTDTKPSSTESNPQPSTSNQQPFTTESNPQPSTQDLNPLPSTSTSKLATTDSNQQPSTTESNPLPSTSTSKPATTELNPQPSTTDSNPLPSTSTPKSATKEPEEDALAETLNCIICQEILHDCISLQPCMHSFCSGCYSEWMEISQECPSCRLKVDRINKNHIVNNLVEAYLKLNPDKKRPEEEIQALEAKNKITRDMLYPSKKTQQSLDQSDLDSNTDDDDDDNFHDARNNVGRNVDIFSSDSSDESNDDDNSDDNNVMPPAANNLNPFGPPGQMLAFGTAAPWVACRQCPNYTPARDVLALQPQNPGPAGAPADPDHKVMPVAPAYQCRPGGGHLLCACCFQRMPDRRAEYTNTPTCTIPPQLCSLCGRFFCHAYWGCRRGDCNGCLARLEDMNFGKACLNFIMLENAHESLIFRNYVEGKGLSVRDIWGECLTKMEAREYTCTDQARIDGLGGVRTPVCYSCGVRNFKDLAYCLRRDIPKEELPNDVTSRPDCHWGKNCRTQKNKPEHARRYNHICEQTRLS